MPAVRFVGQRVHVANPVVDWRCRDTRRSRDYLGIVHERSAYGGVHYACDSVPNVDVANHGVWEDEATTCFWCLMKRGFNGRWHGV